MRAPTYGLSTTGEKPKPSAMEVWIAASLLMLDQTRKERKVDNGK